MKKLIRFTLLLVGFSEILLLSGAPAKAQNASEIDVSEFQRRLGICIDSEPWLRDACLAVLRSGDPARRVEAKPAPRKEELLLTGPADEMHMVGIYEPATQRVAKLRVVASETTVRVDRPGKSVALVFSSYEPTLWKVVAGPDTRIVRIILGGHNNARSAVLLNGVKINAERANLPTAYKPVGSRFQPFHEAAARLAGVRKADSFHGDYTAPAEGFVIDDAPGVDTRDEVLRKLLSQAVDSKNLSPKLQLAARAGAAKEVSAWGFDAEGFAKSSAEGKVTRYDAPLEMPRISWPVGVAFDPAQERVWGVSLGGEGFLYRYNIRSMEWAAWSMNNYDAGGLIYDQATDTLVATPGPHISRDFRILTPNAQIIHSIEIALTSFPGLTDIYDPGNGPAPALTPLAIENRKLLVATAPKQIGGRHANLQEFLYLVDLNTGHVSLVK